MMAVMREGAKIVNLHFYQLLLECAPQHTIVERPTEEVGEDCDDVKAHCLSVRA